MTPKQKRQATKEENSAVEAAISGHYAQLLGIQSPWRVLRVDLQLEQQRVVIEVEHDPALPVGCPECGRECARYDHAPERTWRHLDVMQFVTEIRARAPRCDCPEHGVQTVQVPWAEPGGRFTLLFETFAIKVIEACRSFTQACELLRLDWDSVQRIVDRAVARGLLRRSTEGLEYVGLDEKSFGKGQDYISTMTDLKGRRVLEVVPGRDTQSGLALWETLPEAQRKQVQAAAMDMGAGYMAATKQAAPQAAIVHDKFHISKPLNEAVDKVRREEHQRLREMGDESLTGTRFLWLQGAAVTGERALSFEELCERNLKTARAWAHKETFAEFWLQPDQGRGLDFFEKWFRAVRRSKLEPMKKVAVTLKDHLAGLLTYFEHPITNALTEGFNSKIQSIKSDARGFRNFANYRARILFFCGKLAMTPTAVALGNPL